MARALERAAARGRASTLNFYLTSLRGQANDGEMVKEGQSWRRLLGFTLLLLGLVAFGAPHELLHDSAHLDVGGDCALCFVQADEAPTDEVSIVVLEAQGLAREHTWTDPDPASNRLCAGPRAPPCAALDPLA